MEKEKRWDISILGGVFKKKIPILGGGLAKDGTCPGVVLAPLHRVGFINFTTVGHIFLKMDTFWGGAGVCYHRLFSSEFLPQGDWGQKDRDRD